ncbi:MAG: hypothetical protein QM533_13290 [Cytophagales bacterium]|nr:hypothetical protein [Cytophagales bacterium]
MKILGRCIGFLLAIFVYNLCDNIFSPNYFYLTHGDGRQKFYLLILGNSYLYSDYGVEMYLNENELFEGLKNIKHSADCNFKKSNILDVNFVCKVNGKFLQYSNILK